MCYDVLSDGRTLFDRVGAITQNFWFYNRYESICLADGSVTRKTVGVVFNCQLGWHAVAYLQNGAPFCKSCALFIVSSTSLCESIKALGGGFRGSWQSHDTFVYFDAGDDALILQNFYEGSAALRALKQCFFK